MATDTLATTFAEPADLAGSLSKRVFRLFEAQVEDWHDGCQRLNTWEEQTLLDAPTSEQLAQHALALDILERIGGMLWFASRDKDFPDRESAGLVAMTLQDLKDRRALWHGKLKSQQRDEILRDIFHDVLNWKS